MDKNPYLLYLMEFFLSAVLSSIFIPIFRKIALHYGILDHPNSSVKTHQLPTPYLGGCAIALSFFMSVFIMRIFSNYPPGLLQPMWGIFLGGVLVLLLGLVDDILPKGLSFKEKFAVQFAASAVLLFYDIRLNFVHPNWLALLFTVIWVTGVMNSLNIIDIMDGLAGSIALVASFAFLFISLPTEKLYVNFTAAALAGACFGFLPFNLSKNKKIFMGDTGSLFLGYVLAALSVGTEYTSLHNAGVLAPVLILGIPLYDTFFVMLLRYRKGLSPFLGSKDHFALRLEKMGFSRKKIVSITIASSIFLSFCAWLSVRIWFWSAVALFAFIFLLASLIGTWLAKVKVELPPEHKSRHA